MHVSFKNILKYKMVSEEHEIGSVEDVLFKQDEWKVQYLVVSVDAGENKKRILLSPKIIQEVIPTRKEFSTTLNRRKIEHLPSIEEQFLYGDEQSNDAFELFRWAPYWGLNEWADDVSNLRQVSQKDVTKDPDYQELSFTEQYGCRELKSFRLETRDYGVFFVEDFLIDLDNWKIAHVVTSPWLWKRRPEVCVPTIFIEAIDKKEKRIEAGVPKEALDSVPVYKEFGKEFNELGIINHYFKYVSGLESGRRYRPQSEARATRMYS